MPSATVAAVASWLRAHRAHHDARPWQRAATARTQAILVLRWFKDGTDLAVLATGTEEGWAYVCLDGTLIEATRTRERSPAGHDAWYCGKHHRHGGNIQVLTDPTGYPIWTSPVEPGSTHDLTCARLHALPALYAAAAVGLPTLTDKGYTGAGIGIMVPTKGTGLHHNNQQRNETITALRAPAERGNALLKTTWRALRRITMSHHHIGSIAAAALVLQRGTR